MPECPTPSKASYFTRTEARAVARRVRRGKHGRGGRGRLHAYLCECGLFHVGTMPLWGSPRSRRDPEEDAA